VLLFFRRIFILVEAFFPGQGKSFSVGAGRRIGRIRLGGQMCDDFLSLRMKFVTSAVQVVQPFEWPGGVPSHCWNNVSKIVGQLGGSFAYGWALGYCGPSASSGRSIAPVYSRWVNHILWRDRNGQLWEVTPNRNLLDCEKFTWRSTYFLPDDKAQFEIASEETCCPNPAVYVALRPEGEWTADCLCQAERARRDAQDDWLNRALGSLQQAGFKPLDWKVERAGNMITNVWLLVE
jgi:hypothetical protein